jgi:hypothetical protein
MAIETMTTGEACRAIHEDIDRNQIWCVRVVHKPRAVASNSTVDL